MKLKQAAIGVPGGAEARERIQITIKSPYSKAKVQDRSRLMVHYISHMASYKTSFRSDDGSQEC